VVFAHAEEFDIADDHHFVILYIKESVIYDLMDIGRIAACKITERFFRPLRRIQQPGAVRVFAYGADYFAHMIRNGYFRELRLKLHYFVALLQR
jgi:hypothetical protein